MHKAKITVIKTMFNQNLVDEYLAEANKSEGYGTCEFLLIN